MKLLINNFTIITSIKDQASNTMKNYLIKEENFEKINYNTQNHNNINNDYEFFNSSIQPNITLIITKRNLIEIDNMDSIISKDNMIIFLSKHASKSKTPTLTSHSTGNFSEHNLLGGKPLEIGNTFPSFQKQYMKRLYEKKEELLNYNIVIEATHHGPTSFINPMLFIEIGSSEIQWNDKLAASIVCKCVLETVKDIKKRVSYNNINIGIGIGGNHYPQKFNNLILFSNVAFGPIISKYNLAFINEKTIEQMKLKSIEKIGQIYIDEKGLGKEKEKVLKLLKDQETERIAI
jgi:D-aminoacyl-tRNA deacylase